MMKNIPFLILPLTGWGFAVKSGGMKRHKSFYPPIKVRPGASASVRFFIPKSPCGSIFLPAGVADVETAWID
jgi:hypothetical protein